ncbi:hypothetical protein RIR_jg14305.t1 [Rhizophagus irregularis DAOM 181602=DAOM 197198]|nr:hypothetical protein RIR_jg14305.t1 [Rhizophagus irregularis DAOM 181602=DAOM 197198]
MGSLTYFQLTKHVLNDEGSSEYQNNTLLKHIKKAEQILQNVYYKKDNEINLEALPQLNKVKTILNKYDELLEKATKDNFVDLDSILFMPSYQGNYKFQQHCLTCFQLTKHVLNDEGSSEYQNNTLLKHIKKAEQILQNVYYKKDNEISLEALPQLHKVKTILNKYDEPLEK